MSIVILFGTESGTAEFVAGDLANKIGASAETRVCDLAEFPVADFTPDDFYIVVCSTYGEGDPPASARPFLKELARGKPGLAGVRYAVFGLGDSSYAETYSRGSEVVSENLDSLGAVRVGPYGRHDASGREDASGAALRWLENVEPLALAHAERC